MFGCRFKIGHCLRHVCLHDFYLRLQHSPYIPSKSVDSAYPHQLSLLRCRVLLRVSFPWKVANPLWTMLRFIVDIFTCGQNLAVFLDEYPRLYRTGNLFRFRTTTCPSTFGGSSLGNDIDGGTENVWTVFATLYAQ
jgi:hypothetical protein